MANVTVQKDRYTVDSLYQWDKDQELVITGLSLAIVPEIHFTNDAMDKAIVRQSTMDDAGIITAEIPNSLLQKPYKIKAYVCIYEGETFQSLYSIEIPVKARNKPTDYTIEDSDGEIYSFNALENRVLNALETMETTCKETVDSVTKSNAETIERANETMDLVEEKLAGANDYLNGLFEGKLQETGKKYTLLWENPDPTAEFGGQDIELGENVMSLYDEFLITYKHSKEAPYDQYYILLKNRHEYEGEFITGTMGGYMSSQMLEFSFVDGIVTPIRRLVTTYGENIRIYDGVYFLSDGTTNSHNGHLIPGKIYGVKTYAIGNVVSVDEVGEKLAEVASLVGGDA